MRETDITALHVRRVPEDAAVMTLAPRVRLRGKAHYVNVWLVFSALILIVFR